MEMVKVEVMLGKETHELVKSLANMVKVVLVAGKDGFKPEDAMPIVQGLFSELSGEGFKDLDKLLAEVKESPAKLALALAVEIDAVLKSA